MKAADIRRMALALPEAVEAPHFHLASFRVRGKIFATLVPAGDLLNIFVAEQEREQALALAPMATTKLEWAGKVVGLQVRLAVAKPALVRQWLQQAWARKAPKSLLALTPGDGKP